MALTDKKVTDALLQTGVVSAPDKLTGTAAENKAVFDRLMRNVAQSVINPVIDELVGEQGAANIGAAGGGTVQSRLDACELPAQSQEKADEALRAAKEYTDAHAARRDNPHGVDVGQIGAETPQGAQAKADAAQAAACTHSDAHAGRRDNPHGVSVTQIGAETPSGAQSKVDAALTAARQYTDAEVKKQIAQAGAVAADGQGNAENANRLGDIPADNYLPETLDALNVLAAAPHPYTTNRPCILRPSFRGRTVQEGVPSPENPAPIKGVLNPWARAYTGEPVPIDTRAPVSAAVADLQRLPHGTADRVVYRDGHWGVARNVIKVVLDGTEEWGWDDNIKTYCYTTRVIREGTLGNFVSDRLTPNNNVYALGAYEASITWGGTIYINFPGVPQNDVNEFKAWLAANPITVYGPAATPTFEPIPAWDSYPYIAPINSQTTVTPANPALPISPDNPATIVGTACNTTAYTIAPLMALPDGTTDRIVYRDGQWGVARNVIKVVLDGTEEWGWDESAKAYYHTTLTLREYAGANLWCDNLSAGAGAYVLEDYQAVIAYAGSVYIKIPAVPENNITALKAWLTTNPITVYGPAATPTFEPIPSWNAYGRIDPITVTTTITKPNPDAPISPDNVATITGTPVVTTGYRGMVRQLVAELFDGDDFGGANLSQGMQEAIFDGTETWGLGTGLGDIKFFYHTVGAVSLSEYVLYKATCNRFVQETWAFQWNNKVTCFSFNSGNIIFQMDGITTVESWKAKLAEWAAAGQPLEVVYELAAPIVTRHNLDIPLTPGAWTIECGDDNGLLEGMSVKVLPDPATYGHRVYPYQHSKAGAVHQLTGTAGAQEISFTATAPYLDGDTWALNGAPVAVTYADGQELLPTAVIAGDVVRAVIEGGMLRPLREKPTPQPNLLDNADPVGAINQRGGTSYPPANTYCFDRWIPLSGGNTTLPLTVNAGYIHLPPSTILSQPIDDPPRLEGRQFTFAMKRKDGSTLIGTNVISLSRTTFFINSLDTSDPWQIYIPANLAWMQLYTTNPEGADIVRIKLEPGPRFTGWDEPKPGETLAECQRYQLAIKGGVNIRASYIHADYLSFMIPVPVTLRTNPVISSGNATIKTLDGIEHTGFEVSLASVGNSIQYLAHKPNHGLTDAMLFLQETLFDANL